MIPPEVRALVWKEWRQLRRNRAAMTTALLLPAILMLGVPLSQVLAFRHEATLPAPGRLPAAWLPPGLSGAAADPRALVRVVLPVLVALGGMVVPAVTAIHTVVAERETRSIELLAALPVRVGQVIAAKLLVIGLLAGGASVVLVGVDAAVLLATGFASVGYVVALVGLLLAALSYSTASALLTALLARDFRTANNINGLLLAPTLALCLGVLLGVPAETGRVWLLAGLFALATAVAVFVAVRIVTFERLLR